MMDRQNWIYLLLDILLVIGAILAVATIDGGELITATVEYHKSIVTGTSYADIWTVPADSSGFSDVESSGESPSSCEIVPQPGALEGRDFTEVLAALNDCSETEATPLD